MKAADVIRLCARLVPRERRDTWRRQWDADLAAQAIFLESEGRDAAFVRRDLRARSLGAFRHALWLRVRHWRSSMILQDIRYAARGLRQRPAFTAAIVLTLGLAMGANATIFSWLDALVLNPLPGVPKASDLVMVRFATPTRSNLSFSYPNYLDVRDSLPGGLAGFAVHEILPVSMRANGLPERVWAQVVSSNIFDVLQVPAAAGRTLQPSDDRAPGASPVAVISHDFWQRRFNGNPEIAGTPLTINGQPFTIVGVAAPGFRGVMNGLSMDMWVPVTMHPALTGRDLLTSRGSGWLTTVARKKPGADEGAIAAGLQVVAARLAHDHDVNEGRTLRVAPLSEDGVASVLLPVVAVIMGVVGLVLLIACANVSGLLLARSVSRQHEMAVRTALGASRGRLVRQLLLESAMLAAAGGLAGAAIALWTSRGLERLLPPLPYPILVGASVNTRVLLFSAGIVVLATLVFGLAPALQGSRSRLQYALGASRAGTSSSHGRARLRRMLVVVQVALAMVLLVSAGLFVRTLRNAYDVDPGFTERNAVLASFDLSSIGYDAAKGVPFYEELLRRASALPGVESASLSTLVPLTIGGGADTTPLIDGYTPAEHEEVVVHYAMVAPRYFETMGIDIVAGRAIDERDRRDGNPVVVINETMARKYWAGRDPIGGRLRTSREWTTVIGVARDGKYGALSEPKQSVMYYPISQVYRPNPVLHVATRGPADAAIGEVRQMVASLSPELAVYDMRTLEEHLRISVAIPRIAALLLGVFGALALTLAAVGLYGLIAFVVGQRTHEIGVRMALGADGATIRREVITQGARLAGLGVAAGAGLALVAMPLVETLLVNVNPRDVMTLGVTAAILLAVALSAVWIPAARASRLDPVKALRSD